jgi:DNA mismatch endonuclease (patch repair protein)
MPLAAPKPTDAATTRKMRANRRRDTGPERALRSELHSRGRRFFVDHSIRIPAGRSVRPDLIFPRARVAVFIDGCFWHACPIHGTQPKANDAYWTPKLAENVARDARTTAALEAAGWRVVRVWEHVPAGEAADQVEHAVALGLGG